MSDEHVDWTAEERRMLAALPREAEPPRRLEAAVMAALDARGLFRRRPRWPRLAAAAAALVLPLAVAFVAGVALGERRARAAAPPAAAAAPRFALFLYEGAGFQAGEAGAEAERVAEYASWARSLAAGGRFVEGEKLSSSGRVLNAVTGSEPDAGAPTGDNLGAYGGLAGYFVISAGDYGEAVQVARSCPHVKYGGTIAVRRIEET